jgi:hypothetical protein
MDSRVLRGDASGPAEWLLVFLQARDVPPRARTGAAVGPAEWLMVFLDRVGTARHAAQAHQIGHADPTSPAGRADWGDQADRPWSGRRAAAREPVSRVDEFLGRLAARGA